MKKEVCEKDYPDKVEDFLDKVEDDCNRVYKDYSDKDENNYPDKQSPQWHYFCPDFWVFSGSRTTMSHKQT